MQSILHFEQRLRLITASGYFRELLNHFFKMTLYISELFLKSDISYPSQVI